MVQLVYCILAILILSILTMTSQRGIAGNLEGQTLAEVETQATGVATEVLEFIDQTYFDRYTIPTGQPNSVWSAGDHNSDRPYCRRVYSAVRDSLATTGSFRKCSSYGSCNYIEGFHQLATAASPLAFQRAGITFNVDSIAVEYVNPTTLVTTSSKTYAKRVTVRVEAPGIYFGEDQSNTLKIRFSRILEYGCATDFNSVPYVRTDQFCPNPSVPAESPCARW